MKTIALQELYDLETTYWWHVGRLSIINKQMQLICADIEKPYILNIGSGTGGTIDTLEKHGKVLNIDTSKEALNFLKNRGYNGKLIKGLKLPFEDNTFDVITALDVLEHIDDDEAALIEWRRVLKPGGSILLTVPAHPWMWSQHDVINNHFRRYIIKDLRNKFTDAGFTIKKSSYAIIFSFPLIATSRVLAKISGKKAEEYSSFSKLPNPINNLFISFLKAESSYQKKFNSPIGTSLLFIGKK